MTSLLKVFERTPKSKSYSLNSVTLSKLSLNYNFNCVSCHNKPYSRNISRSNCSNHHILFKSNTNEFFPNSFIVQKRHFSLRETFDSAIITHTAVFKAISESSIVQLTQNFIIDFHNTTDVPWWLSIVIITGLVRCFITLPLAIYQSYVIARLENVRKEMNEIANDLTYEADREVRKNRISEKKARAHLRAAAKKEWKRLIERDNCHPVKASILNLIQIPTWIIFSTSFRNLVYMLPHQDAAAVLARLGLTLGGLPWCMDLTVPDSFAIPIALGITNLAIVEVQAMMHQGEKTKFRRYLTYFFRGFAIFMIPVSATVPSAVSLYWLTSSFFGMCQNLVVVSPRVRKVFNFPPTASANPHPYSHLAQQIKSKFRS